MNAGSPGDSPQTPAPTSEKSVSPDTGRALAATRRRYDRSARFYDAETALAERLFLRRLRQRLWARLPPRRSFLEIGVGTGLNFEHYPRNSSATGIDISERMLAKATARAQRLQRPVHLSLTDVEELPFPDASFDAVIATFVFCSVPEPVCGLREALRVLKPGGTLLLLEHVRSEGRVMGKLMDLLNPLAVRLTGANINRWTVANVGLAGFQDIRVDSHVFGIVKLIEARRRP